MSVYVSIHWGIWNPPVAKHSMKNDFYLPTANRCSVRGEAWTVSHLPKRTFWLTWFCAGIVQWNTNDMNLCVQHTGMLIMYNLQHTFLFSFSSNSSNTTTTTTSPPLSPHLLQQAHTFFNRPHLLQQDHTSKSIHPLPRPHVLHAHSSPSQARAFLEL